MPTYDLAVIGGGPAGSAAAILAARQGLRVAVFERGAVPRDKVCGEFISAEARPLLAELAPGMWETAPAIAQAAWTGPRGRRAAFDLPQPGVGISRLKLDPALWAAAGAAGATLHPHTAATAWSAGELTTSAGGFRAHRLIVAAGRWWSTPGLKPPPDSASPWIGVKARFEGLPATAAVELYVFRGGYCGLAPVENGWTNVCCLVHRQAAGALAASRDFSVWITATAAHPALIERLRPGRQVTPTVITAPVSMGADAAVRGGALMVGDAGGFVDPFTGDGLARALLSARLAVTHLNQPGEYARGLERASRRSFHLGAAVRRLTLAPPWLQEGALRLLARPRLARPLVAATRWRTL